MDRSQFVTIVIPTYNRSELLRVSLASALAQDYKQIEVLVMDNASTDNTKEVVESFADERIIYHRNEVNIGMVRNFNLGLELNRNPFLAILQDDDLLLPGFARETVTRLLENPKAGFAYTLYGNVDNAGKYFGLQDMKGTPADPGIEDGREYLHMLISQRGLTIHNTTMLYRASALLETGNFDSPHAKHITDFNLLVRLANKFDVAYVPKELVYIRTHVGQETEVDWRSSVGTGRLGYNGERIDALAYLIGSDRAADPEYRKWLMNRLLQLNALRSSLAHSLLPSMYWTWQERLETAQKEIDSVIPESETFVLIDDDNWGTGGVIAGRKALPFSEKDGVYWGCPVDDATAIEHLNTHKQKGFRYIVLAWPSFWWIDYYLNFMIELEKTAEQVFKSSRIVIFKLHGAHAENNQRGERSFADKVVR